MLSTYQLPATPLSIGRVLDAGTRLYTQSFQRIIPLSIGAQVVLQLPALVMLPFGSPAAPSGIAIAVTAVVYVAAVVAAIGLYLGVIVRLWQVANGTDLDTRAALQAGYRFGVPFVLGGLLYMLLVMGGIILLIVPGIYLAMSMYLYSYLVVIEKLGAVASLKRSHALIRGHWWRSATIATIPLVLMLCMMAAFQFLPVFLFGLNLESGEFEAGAFFQFAIGVVGAVINAILLPWYHAVLLALYNDLCLRREGGDLEQRLAALGSAGA